MRGGNPANVPSACERWPVRPKDRPPERRVGGHEVGLCAVNPLQGDHMVRRAHSLFPSCPPHRPAESGPGLNPMALPAGLGWGWQLQAQDHPRRTWSPRRGGGTLASLGWEPLRCAWSQLPAALMPPADAPALPARDRRMWPDSRLATTQVKAARCPLINRRPRSAQ